MPNTAINEALLQAVRDAYREIAELRAVLNDEFGGHTDAEGACGGAIRVMRKQAETIAALRFGVPPISKVGRLARCAW